MSHLLYLLYYLFFVEYNPLIDTIIYLIHFACILIQSTHFMCLVYFDVRGLRWRAYVLILKTLILHYIRFKALSHFCGRGFLFDTHFLTLMKVCYVIMSNKMLETSKIQRHNEIEKEKGI